MATTLTMPEVGAGRPGFRKTVANGFLALWTWRRRLAERAELRRLLERADDRMLSDVGLTRAQLADVAGRPFWQA